MKSYLGYSAKFLGLGLVLCGSAVAHAQEFDRYCHANLASADGSAVTGQTDITINFQVSRAGDDYYAYPINFEVKNLNIAGNTPLEIHWVEGNSTKQVVSTEYDSSKAEFTGEFTHLNSDYGKKIMSLPENYYSGGVAPVTYPFQIAIEVGNNKWLDDPAQPKGHHNFNVDLGKAFQAQGAEQSPCFQGELGGILIP